MNYKMVGFVLGRIFLIEAVLMLFPMGCAALYGEWNIILAFLWPALILLALGLVTSLRTPKNTKIYARDGLAIVALVWVLMSVFGALPFVISGEIPSFVDALFETVSGFTTTGSTILTDVEALSHGTLFWRSFSHWIGGMGVLVRHGCAAHDRRPRHAPDARRGPRPDLRKNFQQAERQRKDSVRDLLRDDRHRDDSALRGRYAAV